MTDESLPESAECPSQDADCPLEASRSICWWNKYKDEEVVAFDTEMVTLLPQYSPTKKFYQQAATVDIVDTNLKNIYSSKVYHEPGTFKVDKFSLAITGFENNTFAERTYPKIEDVRKKVEEMFEGKLVITVGGRPDFAALGLEMANFDYFDLQSHFFIQKVNENGIMVREGHSLRSLAAHYLKYNPQENRHTSFEDAKATMKLFEVYKSVKKTDDPNNCSERFNSNLPYNHTPVIPHSLKKLFTKK